MGGEGCYIYDWCNDADLTRQTRNLDGLDH